MNMPRFALTFLVAAFLLTCFTTYAQASLAAAYCSSVLSSPLATKFVNQSSLKELKLGIEKVYNPGLTNYDYKTIFAYKNECPQLYNLMNCHLKVNGVNNTYTPGWVNDLTSGLTASLKKLPKYELETFRGTGLDYVPRVGDILQNQGFLSTSKSATVAAGFSGGRYMLRFGKSGGRDITGVQGLPFAGELEVIIIPGKCFQVMAFGNNSKWWSGLKDSINYYDTSSITFIDLLKVKCPKTNMTGVRTEVLSVPTQRDLDELQQSIQQRRFVMETGVPSNWTCAVTSYNTSDGCDCGCGAWDPDCDIARATLLGCPTSGSYYCSPKTASCVPATAKFGGQIPSSWNCNPAYYAAKDGCDCGCGAWDPDCGNQDVTSYAFGCLDNQFCNMSGLCEDKKYVPPEWTCEPKYYNASDGCDCGCGAILDPDCLNPDQEVLNCPCTTMNCTLGFCTGECQGVRLRVVGDDPVTPADVITGFTAGALAGSIIGSFAFGIILATFIFAVMYSKGLILTAKSKKLMKTELKENFIQQY